MLNAVAQARLAERFTVVGTHALYAYEAAAGVRIVPGALATQDVDLLWDARRRVQFLTTMGPLDKSMLQVLQTAEPSFRRKDGDAETAIDDKGFEDRTHAGSTSTATRTRSGSPITRKIWPVQAERRGRPDQCATLRAPRDLFELAAHGR